MMFPGDLLRPPRHLLAVFLVVTLLPTACLIWAGWLLLQQDKRLEDDAVRSRRDAATDLIVAALQQTLQDTARRLSDPSSWPALATHDAFVVAISPGHVETIPPTRLLYYPVQPASPDKPEAASFSTETDVDKLRALTRSADPAIRAGADVQLAILLRAADRHVEALDVYAHLANEVGVTIAGNPADLVARVARCEVLSALNLNTELRREAEQLDAGLRTASWQLDKGSYENYSHQVAAWLGSDIPAPESQLLATKLTALWNEWEKRHDTERLGNSTSRRVGHQDATLVWNVGPDRLAVLVAGRAYLQHAWLPKLGPLLNQGELRLTLQDAEQLNIFGESVDVQFASQRPTDRTGLPWNVVVGNRNPDEMTAQSDARQRLYLVALALLLTGVAAGSFFVGRSVRRELAVARLQSDFVATVSHEFRTPLTSLRQTAEVLSEGRESNPDLLPVYYQAQMRATERLQRLVESLLDFGRMEARAKPYRMQRFGLSEWARDAVEEFRSERAWKDHRIEYQSRCDNGSVAMAYGDRDALGRALRNLVDNAIKYSPGARTVWVELGRRSNRLTMCVRDEGFGISPGEQKQIFRKFVRGSASKTHGIKGTGIGLTIVEQIVRAHDGEIHVDSEPGVGSTFTIVLPESRN